MSMPIVAMKSPISNDTTALESEPRETITAVDRPITASQKNSKEVKRIATSASSGAVNTRTIEPNRPPITASARSTPSTSWAWPFCVSA